MIAMSDLTTKPTVDLGHPTEPHGRIPAFNTIEEEAEFWDTHDITDFIDEGMPAEFVRPSGSTTTLFLRLDRSELEELDRRAAARGTDTASLARAWIEERLREDADDGTVSPAR